MRSDWSASVPRANSARARKFLAARFFRAEATLTASGTLALQSVVRLRVLCGKIV